MNKIISSTFKMDAAHVKLRFSDDNRLSIDTIAVENEIADTMLQRPKLDWLIYTWPPKWYCDLLI
jgi:hypothetical protein